MHVYTFLAQIIVVFNHHQLAEGLTITAPSNVTVHNGTTLTLVWNVIKSSGDEIVNLRVYVLPDTGNDILTLVSNKPTQSEKAIEMFGANRLSATFTESKYEMNLTDIRLNESDVFQLYAIYRNGQFFERRFKITVTVTGSPETCGESLKPAYNITETVSLTVTQDICGHPKPTVKWKLEKDTSFSGSFSSVLINNASRKYRYSLTTRNMVRSNCGKKIMYNGRNEFGNVRGNSTIYISFKPSKITLTSSYRYNASCVYLTWQREDTGNCLLTYHLKFDDKEDVYSTFKTNFSLCHSRCTSILSIWASYKGNTSDIFDITIHSITPRPDTTIMPSFTTTSKGKIALNTDDCQYASKIAIAVVTTIVIGLILNIVIFVILKNKGFLQFNKNLKKMQHPEQRDDDNYEVSGTTSSHYADLNVKSLKPSIYAELTKTSDSSKQYAEIELNETKRNMYANINT